jgi:hypothetical protein
MSSVMVMLTPLLVLVAAAPVEVVARSGVAEVAAMKMLARAFPGATIIDGTGLYLYLFDSTGLMGQLFDDFTAAPHEDWPAPLAATWHEAMAFCKDQAGPLPWKTTFPSAMACGKRLSLYLWERFAAHHGAHGVTVLSTMEIKEEKRVRVSGQTWRPSESTVFSAEELVTAADVKVALERVVTALVGRVGVARPRAVIGEFFTKTPAGVDPLANDAVVTGPVPKVRTCETMPASLSFSEDSVLAKSVTGRWRSSITGSGAETSCSLTMSRRDETDTLVGPLQLTTAMMRCAGVTVSAEAANSPIMRRSRADVISAGLVKELAEQWCRAASPEPKGKSSPVRFPRQ